MLKIKLLYTSILLFPTISLANITPEQCGLSYDTKLGNINETRVYKCDTKSENKTILKTLYIENYKELFDQINIKFNQHFFDDYLVKKILNDIHVNSYTLTYMVYQEENLFTTYVSSKKLLDIDDYITSVKTGGKHIVLYHIPCQSKNIYNKIKKRLQSIKTIKELKQLLSKIKTTNHIIVKEFYNQKSNLIPTDRLSDSFENIDKYHQKINQYAKSYQYSSNTNQETYKQTINKVLSLYDYINDINYYKHHIKFFKPISKSQRKKLSSLTKEFQQILYKTKKNINYINENNNTKIVYKPQFYKGYIANSYINIKDKNISMSVQEKTLNKIIINPSKKIKISLESKIDIQNKEQILRIKNKLIFKYNKNNHEKQNISILKDTYVDYPNMRFESLQNNYGTLNIELTFDKYKQYKQIKGTGIIRSAICGYNIQKSSYKIECKSIKYNKIEIKLRHEEE